MWLTGWFGKEKPGTAEDRQPAAARTGAPVGNARQAPDQNSILRAGPDPGGRARAGTRGTDDAAKAPGDGNTTRPANSAEPAAPPDTSALNAQAVQAAQFSNFANISNAPDMVTTPPEIMVGQTTGLAVQDAANYMNAIMQIAVAAQAVAIKKAAEGPVAAVEEIPLMAEIQKMVSAAVTVYGDVSTTAGTSSQTIISDFKSS